MEFDTTTPTYLTSDPTSFAYKSARERWPAIITGAIDDVHRTVASLSAPSGQSSDADLISEGKQIVSSLGSLKYELQHNRVLSPIPDDGVADVSGYNVELEARGPPKWHDVQWLYAECYLYRRMSALFATSKHAFWKAYDPFQRQKMNTFKSSRPAVLELASKYREIVAQIRTSKDHAVVDAKFPREVEEAEKTLFIEMAEICLWGNATDLSLLTSLTYEDIQKLQGSEARKQSEQNVLVNDLERAFGVLNAAHKAKQTSRRVDIVLDNAGFELYVDLILAGYLIATGLATEVVIHPKSIPWFVSDVVPKDFSDLLNAMADPKPFYEEQGEAASSHSTTAAPMPLSDEALADLQFLFDDWTRMHAEGQLILRPNRFWTHAGSFWRMPHVAPDLVKDLAESELVVFKGDLNYRKLTGDAAWPADTPFATAIGPLGPSSGAGLRILALRTCKADVVVGLPKGKDEEIRATEGGGGNTGARMWAWSGKWAVVQFSDGKS